jgi:hypothetical protein
MINNPVIHIWSPHAFHEESYIVGNREGLIKLYQEIGSVLNQGKGKLTASFFISDGEGYDMDVILIEDTNIDKIAVPYLADYAEEKRKDAVHPWDIEGDKE